MNRSAFRVTLVAILAAAFLAPPLSQALCSDGCVGGACDTPPTATLCDLDATGGCCGDAEYPVSDPAAPQFTDACRLCPCYEQARIGDFVVPDKTRKLKWTPVHLLVFKPLPIPGPHSEQKFHVFSPDTRAHGPPLYQRHHALLI